MCGINVLSGMLELAQTSRCRGRKFSCGRPVHRLGLRSVYLLLARGDSRFGKKKEDSWIRGSTEIAFERALRLPPEILHNTEKEGPAVEDFGIRSSPRTSLSNSIHSIAIHCAIRTSARSVPIVKAS